MLIKHHTSKREPVFAIVRLYLAVQRGQSTAGSDAFAPGVCMGEREQEKQWSTN